MILSKRKCFSFEYLINKIKVKIGCLKVSLLSQAGQNTLIKSLVLAIPIYNMSILQLPKGTTKDIVMIIRKFRWGEEFDGKKTSFD